MRFAAGIHGERIAPKSGQNMHEFMQIGQKFWIFGCFDGGVKW